MSSTNNKNPEENKETQIQKSESFFYKHRWTILIILAFAVAIYCVTNMQDGSILNISSKDRSTSQSGVLDPKLGSRDLIKPTVGSPSGTELIRLFR
jgi:hypothetical protein